MILRLFDLKFGRVCREMTGFNNFNFLVNVYYGVFWSLRVNLCTMAYSRGDFEIKNVNKERKNRVCSMTKFILQLNIK